MRSIICVRALMPRVSLNLYGTCAVSLFAFCSGLSYWELSQNDVFSQASGQIQMLQFAQAMLSSKLRIMSLIVLCFWFVLLVGKIVQNIFFGELRDEERRRVNDRVLNYIIFKIVFSGVILDMLGWHYTLSCLLWYTVLGFLKIFTMLCADRFNYLGTTMEPFSSFNYIKVVTLSTSILFGTLLWICFGFYIFPRQYDVLLVLNFECVVLLLDALQNTMKFGVTIGLKNWQWETQTKIIYHIETLTDILSLCITLLHYLQLWYLHGISLTLVDAVLVLNVRKVFNRLSQKISAFRNYRHLLKIMDSEFQTIRQENFQSGEFESICLICRDEMVVGKKLRCSHVFHESCILSWIGQHNSCPACREPLTVGNGPLVVPPEPVRWLPQPGDRNVTPEMVAMVREVAPHVPENIIRADLAQTGSVNLTIANIFEGRVQIPEPVEDEGNGNGNDNRNALSRSSSGLDVPVRTDTSDESSLSSEIERLENSLLPVTSGFASSSSERQELLEQRKKALKAQNRLAYLKKLQNKRAAKESAGEPIPVAEIIEEDAAKITPFSTNDSQEMRRRRAIEAAEKRRQNATSVIE